MTKQIVLFISTISFSLCFSQNGQRKLNYIFITEASNKFTKEKKPEGYFILRLNDSTCCVQKTYGDTSFNNDKCEGKKIQVKDFDNFDNLFNKINFQKVQNVENDFNLWDGEDYNITFGGNNLLISLEVNNPFYKTNDRGLDELSIIINEVKNLVN